MTPKVLEILRDKMFTVCQNKDALPGIGFLAKIKQFLHFYLNH